MAHMDTQTLPNNTDTQTREAIRPRIGRPHLWRRVVSVLMVLTTVWIAVIVALAALIHSVGGAQATPPPADVIIVLGSGLRRDGSAGDALWRRSRWASQAWENGLASAVICTGGQAPGQWRSEANACHELLTGWGVPDSVIHLEELSRSTEENAIHAREIMQANGWQNAILITDSFHMLRAGWIFDLYEIDHVPYPVPREWVRTTWYVSLLTREIAALHWQAALVVFDLPFTNFKF